jgi:hypothetical protein
LLLLLLLKANLHIESEPQMKQSRNFYVDTLGIGYLITYLS